MIPKGVIDSYDGIDLVTIHVDLILPNGSRTPQVVPGCEGHIDGAAVKSLSPLQIPFEILENARQANLVQ